MAKYQRQYVESVQKYMKEEKELRSKCKFGDDAITSCKEAYDAMLLYFATDAQQKEQQAKKMMEVADEFKTAHENLESDRKEVLQNERKWSGEMKAAAVDVTKKRRECEKINMAFQEEQNKLSDESRTSIRKNESYIAPNQSKGKLMVSKIRRNRGKSTASLQDACLVAAKKYQKSIVTANKRLHSYWKENIVLVFSSFQKFENDRIDVVGTGTEKMYQIQENGHKNVKKLLSDLRKKLSVDSDVDMKNYTEERIHAVGPPPAISPFIYQFQFDPEEIAAGKMYTPDSIFSCTLRRLMERQQGVDPETSELLQLVNRLKGKEGIEIKNRSWRLKKYPNCFIASEFVDWLIEQKVVEDRDQGKKKGQKMLSRRLLCHVADKHIFEDGNFFYTLNEDMAMRRNSGSSLTVPLIFKELMSHLRRLDGYNTEGIFRIPFDQNKLNEHKKDMENGKYEMKGETSPHAAACLLKMWLRLLAEPLISDNLYDDAIKMGQTKEPNSDDVMKLFHQLDVHHQNLIKEMSEMCVEIENNEKVTKMTLDNLAIVFAPAFLSREGLEPMESMKHAKFQCAFVASLFKTLHENESFEG